MERIGIEELNILAFNALINHGLPIEAARATAHSLVFANMVGRPTHGVSRVLEFLPERIKSGAITPDIVPTIREVNQRSVLLDGQGGLGYYQIEIAKLLALHEALIYGRADVTIINANPSNLLMQYALDLIQAGHAAGRGFGVLITTSSTPYLTHPFGSEKIVGSNAICYAIPSENPDSPLIFDVKLGAISIGEIIIRQQQGKQLPDGVALNSKHEPTNNPNEVIQNGRLVGSILPNGILGFGLAASLHALMLSYAPDAKYATTLSVFELDPGGKKRVAAFQHAVKSSGDQRVRTPGELSLKRLAESRRTGSVWLSKGVIAKLRTMATNSNFKEQRKVYAPSPGQWIAQNLQIILSRRNFRKQRTK